MTKPIKRRYLLEYIRPGIGTPSPGMSNMFIGYYANDRNAFRFMAKTLAKLDHFPAGQYQLSHWPKHYGEEKVIGTLYKKA